MAKIPFDKLMKSFTLAPGETQPGLSEVNLRYLQEIEARNVIRKEAHLPLLDVAKELAHLEQVARAREIENFVRNSPLRTRVQAKCLFLIRKRREEPDWIPRGFLSGGGLAFSLGVDRVMRNLWKHGFRLPQKAN